MNSESVRDLKEMLLRTWSVFFAAHGNLTATQQTAIRPIFEGHDTLLIAPTASGKTEAVIAPLLERLLPLDTQPRLQLLYICPTRALVRDMYLRLLQPLEALRVSLAMKTGDVAPFGITPTLLLTTPESADSLLTRAPRLFINLQAIIIDEIHLFDNRPRGDQIRCLLPRIERIRSYANPACTPMQRVALSATVADPAGVAGRYMRDPVVIEVVGGREIDARLLPVFGMADIVEALAEQIRPKTLIFCNTRNEVEYVAAYLRRHLPYDAAVFVHYSNLDAALRLDVETRFAHAGVAVCVSSSTLELGIDIGSIDQVALVGAPHTLTSFLQRIGRGGRRSKTTQVLCMARSPLDWVRFEALLAMAQQNVMQPAHLAAPAYHFRPSVLVQQLLSMFKQSPTGGVRWADLRRVAPRSVHDDTLRHILTGLAVEKIIISGRPGEWRPAEAADPLFDHHEIYSNIGGDRPGAIMIDAYTGRRIAQTAHPYQKGDTLLMGGLAVQVQWQSQNTYGVQRGQRDAVKELPRFASAPAAVPLAVSQAVAQLLALEPGQLGYVLESELTGANHTGMWLFHFWGDVYGFWLAAMLKQFYPTRDVAEDITPVHEHALYLPFRLDALPPWDGGVARTAARLIASELVPLLEMGRFHHLLPPSIRFETMLALCEPMQFEVLYRQAELITSAELRTKLLELC